MGYFFISKVSVINMNSFGNKERRQKKELTIKSKINEFYVKIKNFCSSKI